MQEMNDVTRYFLTKIDLKLWWLYDGWKLSISSLIMTLKLLVVASYQYDFHEFQVFTDICSFYMVKYNYLNFTKVDV